MVYPHKETYGIEVGYTTVKRYLRKEFSFRQDHESNGPERNASRRGSPG